MTIERNRHREISFACDTPGCYEGISTLTDDFHEALTMLRATRWTTEMKVENGKREFEHFCQQCSDEISRIKEDSLDTLLKGVPKK